MQGHCINISATVLHQQCFSDPNNLVSTRTDPMAPDMTFWMLFRRDSWWWKCLLYTIHILRNPISIARLSRTDLFTSSWRWVGIFTSKSHGQKVGSTKFASNVCGKSLWIKPLKRCCIGLCEEWRRNSLAEHWVWCINKGKRKKAIC